MSDFLLNKSCKLLQESKHIKRSKQSEKLRLKKKKNCLNLRQLEEEKFKNNILKNLEKLKQLSKEAELDIFDQTLDKNVKNCNEEKEKETVFTEKDFEEFEKEYFAD